MDQHSGKHRGATGNTKRLLTSGNARPQPEGRVQFPPRVGRSPVLLVGRVAELEPSGEPRVEHGCVHGDAYWMPGRDLRLGVAASL
jgi:hypothetical protein